jgi:hypothetical protein
MVRGSALLAGCAAAVLALAAGCGGGSGGGSVSGAFAGRVANTQALIAIVTDGTQVRAYVCDGTPDGRLVLAEWFKGQKSGESADIISNTGIAELKAQFTATGVSGTVTIPASQVLTFQAAPATGDGGLYGYKQIHNNQLHWAGWVVLPTGEQTGAQIFPQMTSQGVTLNTSTVAGQIPQIGSVSPLKVTPSNARFFQIGCTGFNCNALTP